MKTTKTGERNNLEERLTKNHKLNNHRDLGLGPSGSTMIY